MAALRILVADDNSDAAMTLAELLPERGHKVRTATDGQSAVHVAVIFHPQVSVLDMGRDRALAREAGFDYQLTKPANFESLVELFETAHA